MFFDGNIFVFWKGFDMGILGFQNCFDVGLLGFSKNLATFLSIFWEHCKIGFQFSLICKHFYYWSFMTWTRVLSFIQFYLVLFTSINYPYFTHYLLPLSFLPEVFVIQVQERQLLDHRRTCWTKMARPTAVQAFKVCNFVLPFNYVRFWWSFYIFPHAWNISR